MKAILRFFRELSYHIPSRLPQGMTEFHAWADSIIDHYGMPNNDSTKWPLAIAITHLSPTTAYMPKKHFGNVLNKAAATQVAFAYIQEAKEKQEIAKQKFLEEQKAKAAEVTATLTAETSQDGQTH